MTLPAMLPTRLTEMRIPKAVQIGVFGLGFAAVALFIGVPRLLDGTRQGQMIASQLAEATGQRVRIEGAVEVSLWPRPHIALNQLKLLSPDGSTTVLDVQRANLNVTYASLVSGEYSVNEINLVHPVMTLATQQARWLPRLEALSVRKISVTDGIIDIARTGQPERISGIGGSLYLPSTTTLLRSEVNGEWRGAPVHLSFDVGPADGAEGSIGYLKFDVGAAEASISLAGRLDVTSGDRRIDARLNMTAGQAGALWSLFSSLGALPPVPVDAALRQPLTFSARLAGEREAYDLSDMALRLGNWKLGGLARYVTGSEGGLSVAVKGDVVDLALWPTLADWLQRGTVEVSSSLLAAFDVQLEGVTLGSFKVAPVILKGDISNGTIKLANGVAMLPGDGRLQFTGALTTRPDGPAMVDGKLMLESLRLRETLAGLGIEVPSTLDDAALRQLKLGADLRGPWRAWAVPNLDATLDGIRLTGQFAARQDSGVFDVNLNVDQFDLDKYAQAQALPGWLWQLPAANVNLTFRQLRAAGQAAENVTLSAALAPGLLTIKSLDAANFGGNSLRLSGSLAPDMAQDADLTLRLTTQDFASLREHFAPAALLLPAQLAGQLNGPVDLSVRFRQTGGERQQLSSATLKDGGRFDLVVTNKPSVPTTFKIRLQTRETATLLHQLLPGALARPDAVLGLLDFYAEGTQQEGDLWQLSALQGQLAGMSVKGGTVTLSAAPPYNLSGNLVLTAANVDLWKQTLNPAVLLGQVSASLDLSLDRFTIGGQQLDGVTGQVKLAAPGSIGLSNFSGTWQGGKFTANGEATLVPDLAVKGGIDLREANVDMKGGNRFGLSGIMDFAVRLDGKGANWDELVHSLSGDGEFAMDSGSLKGIDFAALTEALQDRQHQSSNLDALLARGGESALSAFGGDFVIDEGVFHATQLRLRTPSASADMKADIDLSTARLDSQANVTLRELRDAPPFLISVSGPVDALAASFVTDQLSQHLQPAPAPAATAPADKPAEPAKPEVAAADKPAEEPTPPANGDALAVLPPEEPVPPSAIPAADDPARPPVASAAELAGQSAAAADKPAATEAAPRRAAQATRQNANRRHTAPAPSAVAGDAPPSIDEMLRTMPALQDGAAAAVAEARSGSAATGQPPVAQIPPESTGSPDITFTPAPAAGRTGGVAPEFGGESPQGVRDTTTGSAPVASVPDEDDGSSGQEPAADVNELMGRVDPAAQ